MQRRMLQNGQSGLILSARRLELRGQVTIHHLLANLCGNIVLEQVNFAALWQRTGQLEKRSKKLLLRELRTLADRTSRLNVVDVHHRLHRNTPFFAATLELDGILVRLGNRIKIRI